LDANASGGVVGKALPAFDVDAPIDGPGSADPDPPPTPDTPGPIVTSAVVVAAGLEAVGALCAALSTRSPSSLRLFVPPIARL
jgi:hypothetical protein